MPELTEAAVNAALKDFPDPDTGRGAVQQGQIENVRLEGNRLSLTLKLTTHAGPLKKTVQADLIEMLRNRFPALGDVTVNLGEHYRPAVKLGQIGLSAKSVVAVGSGKGGVGKSTIAASLAFGMKNAGCKVGLMDADVYGPSVPHLIGVNRRPEPKDGKIIPIEVDGLKVMSMGFLVPPEEAVVWRGPMLHGAITQFLRDTLWGELDYLFIDLPPGTGDIALTLSQLLPLTGAVVVCTPQDVALIDAVKAIAMFRKVKIPVLGMVENMSYFLCPDNGKRYDIFGHGGAQQKAREMSVPFLGEVPINMQIRILGDEGKIANTYDEATCREHFETLCYRLAKNISDQAKQAPSLPSLSVL